MHHVENNQYCTSSIANIFLQTTGGYGVNLFTLVSNTVLQCITYNVQVTYNFVTKNVWTAAKHKIKKKVTVTVSVYKANEAYRKYQGDMLG